MPELVTDLLQAHPYRMRGDKVEHLLLLRSPDDDLCPDIWQVITGGIEPGERSADAARRELLEETGLATDRWHAMPTVAMFYFAPRDQIVLSPVFACELPPSAEPLLSAEHAGFRWLGLEEACEILIYPSQREGARAVEAFLRERRSIQTQ